MQFPDDENGDVLRRMAASGFDFGRAHDVDFYAVFGEQANAALVAASGSHTRDNRKANDVERPKRIRGIGPQQPSERVLRGVWSHHEHSLLVPNLGVPLQGETGNQVRLGMFSCCLRSQLPEHFS